MPAKNSSEKRCLICDQLLSEDSTGFTLLRRADYPICGQCQQHFALADKKNVLYAYNDFFRTLLFRYKALGDLALAPVFLAGYEKRLKRKYRYHVIVPAPSAASDNLARGFAALPWIFKSLERPILPLLYKKRDYKQATSKHRTDIYQVIAIHDGSKVAGQKVLLVDDVMTSGHTLRACKRLLEAYQPARIDILVLAARKAEHASILERITGEKHER